MDRFSKADWEKVKLLTAGVILTVAGAAYLSNTGRSADNIETINNTHSVIFNSVASCVAQKNDLKLCEESQLSAKNQDNVIGLRTQYHLESTCEKQHGATCEYNYSKHGSYKPLMIAWQASNDDLKIAVPLYGTKDPNVLWRRDGETFRLPGGLASTNTPAPEAKF